MKRVVVTPEKLQTAITIWLRVAPRHVWRKYEAYERLKADKRHNSEEAPDAQKELADYLAAQFKQVRWEITHAAPKNHG